MQFLDQPLSAYGRLAQDPCTLNEVDVEGDASAAHPSSAPGQRSRAILTRRARDA